jgi:hydrogenase maturation factor
MKQACDAANELDMQIVTGHTGRYEGFDDLVGVCTAYGFASPQEVMTARNVRPDDSMLCTKSIGLETLVAFSQVRRSPARRLLGKSQVGRLSRMFKFQSCVKEALVLSKIRGVHAMHDVAEGGLVAALNEMAEASDAGFSLDLMKLLVPDEVRTLVHEFQLSADELLSMSSTGTLVAALDPGAERKVLARLSELNIPSRIVGKFTRSKRREVKDQRGVRAFPSRARDPFSKICL